MRNGILVAGILLAPLALIAACSATQQASVNTALASVPGQLFCQIQTATGSAVVGLIDAQATAASPNLAPIAVLATNATQAFVQAACNVAAANVGGASGIPVSPPPAGTVPAPVAVDTSKVAA